MAPIYYGPLPGDVAQDELWVLQKALLNLDLLGITDPLELKRLVLALQRHHVSGRMSPDEVRRATMGVGHLGQYIGIPVTASGATTSAESAVDNDAGG
ncbi:hypothetical protein MTO96_044163 [Rhipicephalus appendiculatus]